MRLRLRALERIRAVCSKPRLCSVSPIHPFPKGLVDVLGQVYLGVTTILVKTKLYISQLVECVPGIGEALDRISFGIKQTKPTIKA